MDLRTQCRGFDDAQVPLNRILKSETLRFESSDFVVILLQGPGVAAKQSNELLERVAKNENGVVEKVLPKSLHITGENGGWSSGLKG